MPSQYRSVNEALPVLAHLLLTEGNDVPSRVGATKELAPVHFSITDPLQREIVVEGRKANIAAQIAETMWVLSGRNDVEWLSAYLPRAADFSDDGNTWRAGYGPRLRKWPVPEFMRETDQLKEVIALLSADPGTRRAVMSIWDPAVDYKESKDIPCNNWLHFLSREGVLDLHVAIRSNDLVWGWSGINQFEWSTLLEIVAHYSGLQVGRIHYAVSSLHMYDRHWGKAESWKVRTVHTQRDRRFDSDGLDWDDLCRYWFALEKRIRGVAENRTRCTGPGCEGCVLARDVAEFPDPMLRSWLWVIGWWWTGQEGWLHAVRDSRLYHAAQVGTGPKRTAPVAAAPAPATLPSHLRPALPERHLLVPGNASDEAARAVEMMGFAAKEDPSHRFVKEVCSLHISKDAAYGTSWKKRGELFSILPNIARKVDRLGAGETDDENQTDTACDLMVYLAKYRTWLVDATESGVTDGCSSDPLYANDLLWQLQSIGDKHSHETTTELEDFLRHALDNLMDSAAEGEPAQGRISVVENMLRRAYTLAFRRWQETPNLFASTNEEPQRYCTECGAAEYCHAPGGSRFGSCVGTYAEDDYRGADRD